MIDKHRPLLVAFILCLLLAACSSSPAAEPAPMQMLVRATNAVPSPAEHTKAPEPARSQPTQTFAADRLTPAPARPTVAVPVVIDIPTRVSPAALQPDEWKTLPVIPEIGDSVLEIFQTGQALGNNPLAFSKIGDCGSTPAWFLGDFDRGPRYYDLGPYSELQPAIDAFQGSFARTSLAARSGFNASALFVPLWADRTYCQADEAPLACEYRVQRPAIAFIMLGTNDVWRPDEFEPQMRRIIEFSIQNGVIPVLSTKADNVEGDHSINETIARLANEYEIPLWNYWAAVQPLPEGGLQEDGAHLTWGRNLFDDSKAMQKAWPVRNLTALQTLNAIWEKLPKP